MKLKELLDSNKEVDKVICSALSPKANLVLCAAFFTVIDVYIKNVELEADLLLRHNEATMLKVHNYSIQDNKLLVELV